MKTVITLNDLTALFINGCQTEHVTTDWCTQSVDRVLDDIANKHREHDQLYLIDVFNSTLPPNVLALMSTALVNCKSAFTVLYREGARTLRHLNDDGYPIISTTIAVQIFESHIKDFAILSQTMYLDTVPYSELDKFDNRYIIYDDWIVSLGPGAGYVALHVFKDGNEVGNLVIDPELSLCAGIQTNDRDGKSFIVFRTIAQHDAMGIHCRSSIRVKVPDDLGALKKISRDLRRELEKTGKPENLHDFDKICQYSYLDFIDTLIQKFERYNGLPHVKIQTQ